MPFDPITIAIVLLLLLAGLIALASISAICYLRGMDFNPLFQKREALKMEIESQQRTISDLKSQVTELRIDEANAIRTIAEGKDERKWLEENHDTVSQLHAQIANTKEELKEALDKLRKTEEEYQTKNNELQEVVGKYQEYYIANQSLEAQNKNLSSQNNSLSNSIKIQNETKAKLEETLLSLRQQISVQENQLVDLKQKIDNTQKRLDELKKELEQARENKTKELNSLQAQIDAQQKLYNKIASDCHEEERKLNEICSTRIKEEPVREEIRWGDLNRPYIQRRVTKTKSTNEDEWLTEFKKNLQLCGIKFDDRMINAFHTGLKVADNSPLVVLAGISGTGKSLLPQLYAHAIGMNFLQMAVQPRWDNPQDMFGFYNYMEGRYKATELSRLLWQYDIYNNEDAKSEYKKTKIRPMNLILLDEMNLAKVEYYFSDMLSKLEIRRNINESDNNQRRDAEIEVECGSLQDTAKARRLFIAGNNLFVGTMNEDESTQSLSDKVMDRANVLRFGKPLRLEAHPNTQEFFEKYDPDEGIMDYATWRKKWIADSTTAPQKLVSFLERINSELGLLGRPFAYRVFNAIQTYVCNYPIKGEQGYKFALADQIEMKVLPKLNGIDKESSKTTRDCLKKIGDLLEELGDSELSKTFEGIRSNSDEVFFQWKGISR